jgi:hypothetical protein
MGYMKNIDGLDAWLEQAYEDQHGYPEDDSDRWDRDWDESEETNWDDWDGTEV